VMSIPRDTMVPVYECGSGPGYTGQQAAPGAEVMINSLLQIGGPTCLWKTVEQVTGIRINHFIGIGMLGFVRVVNDLGGVNVCVPYKVNDPVSGLELNAGEQHINGIQALAFWRTREDIGTGSDLERIQRDQFMSAQVVKGVLGSGLLSNPLRLLSVITDAAASMTTDSGMTVADLVEIAESFHDLSSENVQFITVPNQPWTQNPDRIQLEQPQAGQVFSAIAHDTTVPKTSPASATPSAGAGAQVLTTSPSNVKVEILNGSGTPDVAAQAATGLTSRGFDVTGTGDAASFAYTNSVIEYSSAADVAEVNTLKQEISNVTELLDAGLKPGTVELILGSDFTSLNPQVSSSASAQPTPSASASASPPASASASPSASASASGWPSRTAASLRLPPVPATARPSPARSVPDGRLPAPLISGPSADDPRHRIEMALTSSTASGSLRMLVMRRSANLAGCPVRSRSTQTERSPIRAAGSISCTQLLAT
jgi:LCP family protein required for cell wall assembly